MSAIATKTVRFKVRNSDDTSFTEWSDVPAELTVAEIIPQLLEDLKLPASDASGPTTHALRRDSDGRLLNDGDLAEDLADETAVLLPDVNAGAR